MAFLNFLRANEDEEKRRAQQGGVKNRIFNFLDDTLDVAEGVPDRAVRVGRGIRDFGVAAARSIPRSIATAGETLVDRGRREAGNAITGTTDELRKLSYEDRKKAILENEGLAQVLKNKGVTDPTDANLDNLKTQTKAKTEEASKKGYTPGSKIEKTLLGTENVQSYQTRREGYEQALEEGTYTGAGVVGGKDIAKAAAVPLSFLGAGLTVGLDAPGGNVPKAAANKILKGTKDAIKRNRSGLVEEGADTTSSIGRAAAQTPDMVPKEVGIEPVELFPGERQRGLLRTAQEATGALPLSSRQAVREIQPQTYKQMNIDETLTNARNRVNTNFDESREFAIKNLEGKTWDNETSSVVRALVEKAASEGNDTLVKELMDKAATLGTASGQANVLWRGMASAYDPNGMVRFAQKAIDDANKNAGLLTKVFRKGEYSLDDETKRFIRGQMGQAMKLADGPEKDAIMKTIFEKINDRIPPGASELFDAYRYTNLLSNPRTQARNIVGNLFNTMITRPATLATRATTDWFGATLFGKERQNYLKEVPEYFRGMFNSVGDAVEASKAAWRGETPIGQPDLSALNQMRNKNLPKALTVVPRLMEAQDRFLSTLISAGEYAAQKSKGVADDVAKKAADQVAEYSLYRSITDPNNASGQGKLLSKMDQLTDMVVKVGQKHPSFRWFVPFVRTPMNVTKQMIEYSPLGLATLPGSKQKTEQISKALAGSTLTMIGAKMALDGNTTWDAPKDEKERQLFYESGKRPYSIRIGDKWVPMIYFGPYSLAFALPAAARDANQDTPMDSSTSDRVAAAAQNAAKYFSQQTYVQGIANVVDLISGEGDANLANSLGFTAGQAIPLQGLQRYVAGALDPTFRKADGFLESIQKDIPGLSKNLDPYVELTGEESRRNASDYIAPYTLGIPKGSEEDKGVKEANSEFLRTLRKTSKARSKANEDINTAIEARDYAKAQELAANYNEKLKNSFKPWNKKYGQYADDEYLAGEYNKQKIRLNRSSISQRRYNMLRSAREERNLVNR